VQTPAFYPDRPSRLFENPEAYKLLDTNTLFFIFYYQQHTEQQAHAATQLKQQAWRYHKRFQTWFQRHERPTQIRPESETGTYLYFDFEQSWCQRKRDNFTFEYRFLEDETSA
jgi:CCR4-NOT transcription complex subunit 3